LGKNGITFSYSAIKRNKKGNLNSISITLEEGNSKITKKFKNSEELKDIFIGKEKGVLVIK